MAFTVLIGATVLSAASSIQAGKAAKRQAAAEQRRAEVQNIRSVREQIRAARLAQSSMVNTAAQTGGMGGSGLAGGVSSVGSQLAGNLNYMADIAKENTAISAAVQDQAQWQTTGSIFNAIGGLAERYAQITGKPIGNPNRG